MTETRKLRVFLCHASQDKPIVRELYQRLLAEGWIDPWLDKEKLLPGQDWRTEIEQAVDAADLVVICLSNYSVDKEGFVQKELRYAREIALEMPDNTLFLIPLRLEVCDVPRGLRFFQWTDYFGEGKDQNYKYLLDSFNIRYRQVTQREKNREEVEKKIDQASDVLSGSEEDQIPLKNLVESARNEIDETVLLTPQPRRVNLPNRKRPKKKVIEAPKLFYDDRDLSKHYDILHNAQRNLNAGNIQRAVDLCRELVQDEAYSGLVIPILEKILKSHPGSKTARKVLSEAKNLLNSGKKT